MLLLCICGRNIWKNTSKRKDAFWLVFRPWSLDHVCVGRTYGSGNGVGGIPHQEAEEDQRPRVWVQPSSSCLGLLSSGITSSYLAPQFPIFFGRYPYSLNVPLASVMTGFSNHLSKQNQNATKENSSLVFAPWLCAGSLLSQAVQNSSLSFTFYSQT